VLPKEFFHFPHGPLKIDVIFSSIVEEPVSRFGIFDELRLASNSSQPFLKCVNQWGRNERIFAAAENQHRG